MDADKLGVLSDAGNQVDLGSNAVILGSEQERDAAVNNRRRIFFIEMPRTKG